jgi:hypothetical protein
MKKEKYSAFYLNSKFYFHIFSRIYIKDRARLTFKEYKSCTDIERIKNKIKEARKVLRNRERQ